MASELNWSWRIVGRFSQTGMGNYEQKKRPGRPLRFQGRRSAIPVLHLSDVHELRPRFPSGKAIASTGEYYSVRSRLSTFLFAPFVRGSRSRVCSWKSHFYPGVNTRLLEFRVLFVKAHNPRVMKWPRFERILYRMDYKIYYCSSQKVGYRIATW